MIRFSYEALNAAGKEIAGFVESSNREAAVGKIRELGYFPTKIEEMKNQSYAIKQLSKNPPFYFINTVCQFTGYSKEYFKILVKNNHLKEFRDAGKVFFKREDIEHLMDHILSFLHCPHCLSTEIQIPPEMLIYSQSHNAIDHGQLCVIGDEVIQHKNGDSLQGKIPVIILKSITPLKQRINWPMGLENVSKFEVKDKQILVSMGGKNILTELTISVEDGIYNRSENFAIKE